MKKGIFSAACRRSLTLVIVVWLQLMKRTFHAMYEKVEILASNVEWTAARLRPLKPLRQEIPGDQRSTWNKHRRAFGVGFACGNYGTSLHLWVGWSAVYTSRLHVNPFNVWAFQSFQMLAENIERLDLPAICLKCNKKLAKPTKYNESSFEKYEIATTLVALGPEAENLDLFCLDHGGLGLCTVNQNNFIRAKSWNCERKQEEKRICQWWHSEQGPSRQDGPQVNNKMAVDQWM